MLPNLEEWQKYIVLLIDEMRIKEVLIYDKGTEEWQKYIVLLIDEMRIKEVLIYDKGTGELISFTNVR